MPRKTDEELNSMAIEYASGHNFSGMEPADASLCVNAVAYGFFMGWRRAESVYAKRFFKRLVTSSRLDRECDGAVRFYFEKRPHPTDAQNVATLFLRRGFKIGFIEFELFSA